MAKLFVFGIGGTGARVIKSLVMLLASGMKTGDFDIVPILIDPHKDLKELNNVKTLLRLYSDIHSEIYKDIDLKDDGFFKTKLITLKTLSPDTGLRDDFEFDERHDVSFRNFLELANLENDNPTHDFLSLLFTEQNLNDSLSKGFRGSPNVGSIVLNSIKESQGFKAIESAFGDGDRIFIVSSIFGGTGAAGFPLMLKNFRNNNKTLIKEAQIGAVTVMPYFKLSDSDESRIDSNSFLTKTRSALTYYIRPDFVNDINAIYYIADPYKQNKPYENDEEKQNNIAHFIELLSAYSVFKFAENNFTDRDNVYEYCLDGENIKSVNFKNIGNETRRTLGNALINFYIFNKLNIDNQKNSKLPYYKINFKNTYEEKRVFFDNLNRFMRDYFLNWLTELSQNERQFSPFKLNSKNSFNDLIIGFEMENRKLDNWLYNSFHLEQIQLEMSKKVNEKTLKNKGQEIYKYVMASKKSISEVVNKKIKF